MKQWFSKNMKEDEARQLKSDMTRVFGTDEGRRVLTFILNELSFFQEALDDEDRHLQNAAKRIIRYYFKWDSGEGLSIVRKLDGVVSLDKYK